MQMPRDIIVSWCKFINLTYLSESVATLEEKSKNIFQYKTLGLDPKIKMKNILASNCQFVWSWDRAQFLEVDNMFLCRSILTFDFYVEILALSFVQTILLGKQMVAD